MRPSPHQLSPNALRVAGVLGILGPAAYVATWVIAGAAIDGYSPARDAISELAAIDSPTRVAMNSAFVAFGLAGVPLAWATRQVLPGWSTWLLACMATSALATVGAAFFPCSPGCPGAGAAVTDNGHAVMATVGYLALMASPLLAARVSWDVPGWRTYARWSAAAGILGSLGMAAWALGIAGDGYGGALQRLFNTIADVWWAATGLIVLRRAAVGADAPDEPTSPSASEHGAPQHSN